MFEWLSNLFSDRPDKNSIDQCNKTETLLDDLENKFNEKPAFYDLETGVSLTVNQDDKTWSFIAPYKFPDTYCVIEHGDLNASIAGQRPSGVLDSFDSASATKQFSKEHCLPSDTFDQFLYKDIGAAPILQITSNNGSRWFYMNHETGDWALSEIIPQLSAECLLTSGSAGISLLPSPPSPANSVTGNNEKKHR